MPCTVLDAFVYVISFISYNSQGILHSSHFAVGPNQAWGVDDLLRDYVTTSG